MQDYDKLFDDNKALWDAKTPVHVASEFYDLEGFKQGGTSLRHIELEALGTSVSGKKLLHLQCHFGMDTLSWARLGAQATGMDLSGEAIAQAKRLSAETGIPADFVCCNLYDLPKHLEGKFDFVFTSYGTIGWLPDLQKWAAVIANFLKPGGVFYMVDFHPWIWMMDDQLEKIDYSYFNKQTISTEIQGTYADREADLRKPEHGWNHPFSEIFGALLSNGLQIAAFEEYDYSAYDCFAKLVKTGDEKYQIKGLEGKPPMMYSIKAVAGGL